MPTMEACAEALDSRKGRVSKIDEQRNHSPIKEQLVIAISYQRRTSNGNPAVIIGH